MNILDAFSQKKSSGNYAKERLKLVLESDRVNASPDILNQLKNDIINVISKYMEIDTSHFDIQIVKTSEDECLHAKSSLCANIPIIDMKSKAIK